MSQAADPTSSRLRPTRMGKRSATVWLTQTMLDDIKEAAAARGMTQEQFILGAIADVLNRMER